MDDSERLHQVVAESAENFAPSGEDDEPFLLRGALLISEWVDRDGTRALVFVSTDAQGVDLRSWDIRGYVGELLANADAWVGETADDDDDD